MQHIRVREFPKGIRVSKSSQYDKAITYLALIRTIISDLNQ